MELAKQGVESRRVRFASINGLTRADLPLAGEIWRDDACRAPWANRETMKIAALLIRYMTMPDPEQLTLSSIERHIQLTSGEVTLALKLLNLYGAIEAYTVERDEIRVAMHLSLLQRLRVLEARGRMDQLMRHPVPGTFTDDHWHPEPVSNRAGLCTDAIAADPEPAPQAPAEAEPVLKQPVTATQRSRDPSIGVRHPSQRANPAAQSPARNGATGRAGVTGGPGRARPTPPQFRAT